jgi:hypothetical protein
MAWRLLHRYDRWWAKGENVCRAGGLKLSAECGLIVL